MSKIFLRHTLTKKAISKWLLNVQNEKICLSELKKLLFVLIIDKH